MSILHASDDSLVLRFEERIDPAVASLVMTAAESVRHAGFPWVRDVVPSYREVLVTYDLDLISPRKAKHMVESAVSAEPEGSKRCASLIRIPVCYGGEYGPDMDFVCNNAGIGESELVKIHSAPRYLIYMIGFTIGFPYLGGMDERIATPRLQSPRERVPAGSVGIAGKQTGIYTLDSPGGWQIIGRSPAKLVDTGASPPALLSAGDYISFYPIESDEYEWLDKLSKEGQYRPETARLPEAGR